MPKKKNAQPAPQYRLLEYYTRKQNEIDAMPVPDEKDREVGYQELYDYVTKQGAVSYSLWIFRKRVAERLGRLSEETLEELFDRIKKPEQPELKPEAGKGGETRRRSGRKPLTKEEFVRNLKSGTRPGMLFNEDNFGVGREELLKAFEDAMGPAAAEELLTHPDPIPPMDPKFPNKNHRPLHASVEAAKARLTRGLSEAEAQPIRALLDEADRCLEVADPDAQAFVHSLFTNDVKSGDRGVNYESVLNNRTGNLTKQGYELLAEGRFRNKVRSTVHRSDNTYAYEVGETDRLNGPITEAERQILEADSRDPESGLSQDTLDALEDLEKQMDRLDYLSGGASPMRYSSIQLRPSETGDEPIFGSEDGGKLYAFAPLHAARKALASALESGSAEEIRRRLENYQEKAQIVRQMMDTIHSDKLSQEPIASANVESTRENVTTLPGEYTLDYMGHHKLNSVYINYGFAKNSGSSMTELARDPYGTMMRAAQSFADAAGPDAKAKNLGASLALGMRAYDGGLEATVMGAWRAALEGGMGRGIAGIAGLEKDPVRRAKYLARANLATLAATKQVEDVMMKRTEALHKVMSGTAKESHAKRQAIYRSAAILPEQGPEAFSMSKIVDELSKTGARADDWKWKLNTDFFATGSSIYVDLKELAGRNKKLLKDLRQEQIRSGSYDTLFNRNEYLLNAFQQQSKLLQKAGSEPVKREGFDEFRESVLKTHELARNPDIRAALALGAELVKDENFLSILSAGKSEQINTRDSGEYRSMRDKLNEIRDVISALKTGDTVKMFELTRFPMIDAITQAKESAFDYYRLKLKNGTKGVFWYGSGRQRAEEGKKLFRRLQQFQKDYGLLSPARERWENARMTLLEHRGDLSWSQEERERTLCELIYNKSILDAGIPDKDQAVFLEPGRVERNYKIIRTEVLNKFAERGELQELMGEAIEDNRSFRKRVRGMADGWKQSYDKVMAPKRLEAERKRLSKNYALTLACKELKIRSSQPSYTRENPDVAKLAEKILQRPEFRETMERILAGKDLAKLREENEGSLTSSSGGRLAAYSKTSQTIRYEKKCAALSVENLYRLKGRNPSDELRARDVETLYRNEKFRRACGRLLGSASGERIKDMVSELDKPEVRNQTVALLSDIAGKAARREEPLDPEIRINNEPLIEERLSLKDDRRIRNEELIRNEEPIRNEERIQNDSKPAPGKGGRRQNGGKDWRHMELFDPYEGREPPKEAEDQPIYDKDGNVVYAPEEKGPKKGFLQSIMDDVNNPPNRQERPKEVGFGPSLK